MNGWMEGLPLLRFSGGPCFLPVQTKREGGIRWLKEKSYDQLKPRVSTKFKLIATHKVYACSVSIVGRNGHIIGERCTNFLWQRAKVHVNSEQRGQNLFIFN